MEGILDSKKITKNKVNLEEERGSKPSDKGLTVQRYFTQDSHFLEDLPKRLATSVIRDSEGQVVFKMEDIEVPASWSQLAVDILLSKYIRRSGIPKTGHETSILQVIRRIAHTIRTYGEDHGYFEPESAQIFEDELSYMLIHQIGAFNSPVWFNLGLFHEYGLKGTGGHYYWDEKKQSIQATKTAFEQPQCSACFIQSVNDDLMSIFDLVKTEAKLFKFGSGTGTNFSTIRGHQEKLSGGGHSSGLMSFLDVLDRAAGATKSGGTTRRAAKMVCLDVDHPEIRDFVNWKKREEKKATTLIEAGYDSDFNGDAYRTVSGQNSNNSIRVSDDFMKAVEQDGTWHTRLRTSGEVLESFKSRQLWRDMADAAWTCADPGVQFDTTINGWHTCAETGPIRASNPCSEYMFLDDSACNLASLNLLKFVDEGGEFNVRAYKQAVRVFIMAQEILVALSSYPTEKIARNSYDFRPLGLGYANLGTLLMIKGIPYDSDEGRQWAGALTALMTGQAYLTSSELAMRRGPFAGFAENRNSMLKVMRKHKEEADHLASTQIIQSLVTEAQAVWQHALEGGERFGYRNSQVTVLAPTGTIGLLMDCDTTGVEPDFSLVKYKKLAGGGFFKIVNQSVPRALKCLGYSQTEITDILRYILGSLKIDNKAPYVTRELLQHRGLTDDSITRIEKSLPGLFDLSQGFTRSALGEGVLKKMGIEESTYNKSDFNLLTWLGLTEGQIEEANSYICGTMSIDGAPHLKPDHLPVFDCANRCGPNGKRFIAPMGHIRMMAAVQPFLSGAISKTVNLPNETTVEEIEDIYYQSWKLGLKAVAIYRDGCKRSQPLNSGTKNKEAKETTEIAKEVVPATAAGLARSYRRRLPKKRTGFTQEATVGGHKIFLRTGEYENGELGEIFIDMYKEGAAYRSLLNCFAISVSLGLQHGVPLKEYVDKFTFTRFEPSGIVTEHPNIKVATSIIDYVFRVVGMEYLGRTDFLQIQPTASTAEPKAEAQRPGMLAASTPVMNGHTEPDALSRQLAQMMKDAPVCDSCGHTTVRNGSCYRCLNCGNSMGCS